jgi:hypothetical protein
MSDNPEFVILNNLSIFPPANPEETPEIIEDKCRRCGVSCHATVDLNDEFIVIEGLHCKYLTREDSGVWTCSTYETRLTDVPWCQDRHDGRLTGAFAMDCPYVEGAEGYRGKRRLSAQEYVERWPELMDLIRSIAWNDEVNLEGFAKQLEQTYPGYRWYFEPTTEYPGYFWLEFEPKNVDVLTAHDPTDR